MPTMTSEAMTVEDLFENRELRHLARLGYRRVYHGVRLVYGIRHEADGYRLRYDREGRKVRVVPAYTMLSVKASVGIEVGERAG